MYARIARHLINAAVALPLTEAAAARGHTLAQPAELSLNRNSAETPVVRASAADTSLSRFLSRTDNDPSGTSRPTDGNRSA
jgi:hypothetical protein